MVARFKAGQVIRFTYNPVVQMSFGKKLGAVDIDVGEFENPHKLDLGKHGQVDIDTSEFTSRYKEIFVLHPNWRGKVHAIDLKRLTSAEREVLDAIFDPQWKEKNHRINLVNDILDRMDPVKLIQNPMTFYYRFVKVFLKNKDAYRTYHPIRMSGVTVVKATNVAGKVINPKPLFHGVKDKPASDTEVSDINKGDIDFGDDEFDDI
jgi:hypothetical protein